MVPRRVQPLYVRKYSPSANEPHINSNRLTTYKQEAHNRTLTLKEDFPEALEALFEFAYKGDYAERIDGETDTEVAKNKFIQHARVFLVADKYSARELSEYAFERLRGLVRRETKRNNQLFFKFAAEQVYLHDNPFGYDQQHANENALYRAELAKSEGEKMESDEDESLKPLHSEKKDMVTDDFNSIEIYKLYENDAGLHPLDRLKAIIVKTAVKLATSKHLDYEFTSNHLALLAKSIPDFASDFAVASLKSGKLRGG